VTLEAALQAFFAQHPTETFHALAIDAGYIYLDSEEALEQRRRRYSAEWEDETRTVTADEARAVDGTDESRALNYFRFYREKGEPFEAALEFENSARARRRAEGNPYERPGSNELERLRYESGDFEYQQLVNLGLDREYQRHYEKNQPWYSAYARKVRKLVKRLEKDRDAVFRGVKLSSDFRIYAVDHEL